MSRTKLIALCVSGACVVAILQGLSASPAWAKCTGCPPEQKWRTGPMYVHGPGTRIWGPIYDAIAMPPGQPAKAMKIEPGPNTQTGWALEGQACESLGAKDGEVVSEPVVQEFGYINAKRKEVGLEERPASGTLYAQFTCGLNIVELRGALIGAVTPVNKTIGPGSSLNDEVAINDETGKDKITHFEHGPVAVMEMQVNEEGFQEVAIEDPGALEPENATIKIKANGKKPPEFEIKTSKTYEKEKKKKEKEEKRKK